MPSLVNLKAKGLNTQPNQLDLEEGSLTVASNVVIDRDNVIEKRRGFKHYGNSFGTSTDRAKQLMQYRDQLIRHYNDVLQFDNGTGTFTSFPGSFLEPESGIRIKSVAANNNFYFTTSEGIKKIASTTSDLNNAVISNAGGVKAIDIQAESKYNYTSITGFLPADSAVAYRAVWGIKDVNNNLILGTPSPRAEVYNPITPIMIQDFMHLLVGLDNATETPGLQSLTDTDYAETLGIPVINDATDLRTNIIELAEKIDTDIYAALPALTTAAYSVGPPQTVTFTFAAPHGLVAGDMIKVEGVNPDTYDGKYLITSVTLTTITVTVLTDPGTYVSGGTVTQIKYQFIPEPVELTSPQNNQVLVSIQDYMDTIIQTLQASPITEINTANLTEFIDPLDITTSSTVTLTVYIPQDVIDAGENVYFLQLYRSNITQATGTTVLSDLVPDDEMQLVYEAFPTSAELTASVMIFEDVTPDAFAGANLYTNQATGEGILQANEPPPLAKDIARFKNVVFYANTQGRQQRLISLLGVDNMITDFNNGITPTLTITNGENNGQTTYQFVVGLQEITDITCVADIANSLNGTYFDIYSANDESKYRFYYKTSTGIDTPPAVTNEILVRIDIATASTAIQVAEKTRDVINIYGLDFVATDATLPTITVTTVGFGYTTNASAGTSGFTISITQQGRGSSTTTNPKQILLSSNVSTAIAVDETARNIVNIINQDPFSPVNAYYISSSSGAGELSVPGKIQFESRDVNSGPVYFLTNNSNTGSSFNPDLSPVANPTFSITAISSTDPASITTSIAHNLQNFDEIVITASDSPTSIDGLWSVLVTSPTTFTIDLDLSAMTAGSYTAVYSRTSDVESSENNVKINRVYYSKLDQPEAVPAVNYFDVGDSDKAISRIFPLRDSLFVFKEEGLYRISGEVAPFTLALFDSTYHLIAPDSLGALSNLIFGWTEEGIGTVSESGTQLVSRPIDVDLLKLGSNNYPGFRTATFAIGYQSDRSYLVWTILKTADTIAKVCYRYSSVTGAWTTYDKTNTCGIVKISDDKLYLGAGDFNFIEQERKSFTRTDYADREIQLEINDDKWNNNQITFTSIIDFEVGDVLLQEQTLTPFTFNMLLKKLDLDPGISYNNFFDNFQAFSGDSMRDRLVDLATQLDTVGLFFTNYASTIAQKTGLIGSQTVGGMAVQITSIGHGLETGRYINISGNTSTPSLNGNWLVTKIDNNTFSIDETIITSSSTGSFVTLNDSFEDIKGSYNLIIQKLNTDTVVAFSNYTEVDDTTTIESIVTNVNTITKTITFNIALPYIVGSVLLFKSYTSTIIYSPVTMGDPLGYKHLAEATVMFNDKTFTTATLSFSSDLLPAFNPIPFNGDGNGIYGHNNFGEGFFGGSSHGAPFRTYIPRNNQRCRALNIKLEHDNARENIVVYGISVTGEVGYSTRAYR